MKIEILDIPEGQKLSKIVIDFDNGIPKTRISTSDSNNNYNTDSTQIDMDFANAKASVSQEIVEKPVIKDKKREIKVANNMQNLSI